MLLEITKSKLIKRVYDESKPQKANAAHNLYAKLERFAEYVLPQLTQTNLLFDEYTPHDQFHMESLFRISEDLLGDDIINRLYGTEACILACAIYGHDWGMAVSEDEKELIVTGKSTSGKTITDFALLDNEDIKWRSFAKSKHLTINEQGHVVDSSEVLKNIWLEYVRNTHSERSKIRVRSFFNDTDSRLGELIGDVCAGHWYDISKIRTLKRKAIVLEESVNLQALATYMRFIDLLDIGKNRTPYSLWKFVNPRNLFSANEWKKHLALEPVHFERKNDKVLTLNIQGKTDDHKVYASLKDMRHWISEQISENEQLLEEIPGYTLGAIKLDWDIEAEGFEPIDIRFEFDRGKMFELISGEIYDGDPYVFLREIIQNSIDALKIRELQYIEKGASIDKNLLFIKIDVTHEENGNSQIKVTDSGSGMSLYIIRNYLSIIGKSYYRSDEFENLNLNVSPISRFGVGLISCFEIADHITIKTKTDPFINENSESLDIEIENYNQQFKVVKLPQESLNIGTTITINVISEKWKKGDFKNSDSLKVSEYIKEVFGFVEYPILIDEKDEKTMVLSAVETTENETYFQDYHEGYSIWKEPLEFKLGDIVIDSDKAVASLSLQEQTKLIDVEIDGVQFSGAISYFFPKPNVLGSTRKATGTMQQIQGGSTMLTQLNNSNYLIPVRWGANNPNVKYKYISSSSSSTKFRKIYLQGILVPNSLDQINLGGSNIPPNRIVLNVKNSREKGMITSLSRKSLKGDKSLIEEIIRNEYKEEIKNKFQVALESASLINRIQLLTRIRLYLANNEIIEEILPILNWPIPTVSETGKIILKELNSLSEGIEIVPKFLLSATYGMDANFKHYLENKVFDVSTMNESGGSQIVLDNFGFQHYDNTISEWHSMSGLIKYAISKTFSRSSIRLAEKNGNQYIIEYFKKDNNDTVRNNYASFNFSPFHVEHIGIFGVLPLQNDSSHMKNYISKVIFNLNHPVAKILENALNLYNENLEELEEMGLSSLITDYNELGFVGYGFPDNSGIRFIHLIPIWAKKFCESMANASLIELNEDDRINLGKPLAMVTANE